MRLTLSLILVFSIKAMAVDAEIAAKPACPVQAHVLRDGGSIFIEVPSHGGNPSLEIFVDHGNDTKTPGQYYLGDNFVTKAEPMKVEEVLRVLHRIETILVEKYGKEELFRIMMNPLIVGLNLTEEEFVKLHTTDPHFNEKFDVMLLLDRIREYRKQHKTEP